MTHERAHGIGIFLAALVFCSAVHGQTMPSPDVTRVPMLYVVPYAHLDTQWRWEFPQAISEYLLKTMRVNFDYMEKYPHYVFNWTGANRYRLMKEYYPQDYVRLRQYVATGQWFPAGSSVEEGDVNLPSAEGIFRQILYGNTYFRHEFGKASNELMLPDCFGFPASLPSIIAHAGIRGFSTQKLGANWNPAALAGGPDSPEQTPQGIPFNVGMWIGPDGHGVIAALNPGSYHSEVNTDLSKDPGPPSPWPTLTAEQRARLTPRQVAMLEQPREWEQDWVKRVNLNGKVSGVFADYHYVGDGDLGGAAPEPTIKLLEAIVTQSSAALPQVEQPDFLQALLPPKEQPEGHATKVGDGPLHIIESSADQMFAAIPPEMASRMPRYEGDLELIHHSAGSLSSQMYHKQWIIQNENVADAAEKASLAAEWLGGSIYSRQRLMDAWMLSLAGHFHDTGAGTATPRAYQYAWNDDLIAANQFAAVLTSASTAIASGLDTETQGIPVVIYNPLNIEREDIVSAIVDFHGNTPKGIRVFGPDGREVPAQIQDGKVLFLAKAPSVGYAVYDVRTALEPGSYSGLRAGGHIIENARYRIQVDANGDIASIFDKDLKKELLSAPMRMALTTDAPHDHPAWNMDFAQAHAAPRAYVSGPTQIRIVENGPARVALEVTRETENSKSVQTIRLAAGEAGNRIELAYAIDWRTLRANLKQTVPLTASNTNATYSWDIGTVQRGNDQERQFEVGSHRWIDLTDRNGSFGVTVLTDCKNGSDKPDDNTLRITLVRSPGADPAPDGTPSTYTDQENQDWGHHEFVLGLAAHSGGWQQTQTPWHAYRLNDPLIAFTATKHPGGLGKTLSLMHVDNADIRVLALKKAEDSDAIILRMVELAGAPAKDISVSFASPILSAQEVDAQERVLGPATVNSGRLVASFTAYQPRTFALKIQPPRASLACQNSRPVVLQYDLAAASNDDTRAEGGGFDGKGNTLPAEMLPMQIDAGEATFQLVQARTGAPNAVIAHGQTIPLPVGHYNRLFLLAASADGDQKAVFTAGKQRTELVIQSWNGWIGQWDTRIWKQSEERNWSISANHAAWPPADFAAREARSAIPRFPDDYLGIVPGYIKPAPLAWYASHHHTADGLNQPYEYSYLFTYSIDLPAEASTLTLPNNSKIRILAITVADTGPEIKLSSPLLNGAPRRTGPEVGPAELQR